MADIEFCVATEFSVVKVKVTNEGAERSARLQAEHRCLGCEKQCDSTTLLRRGLCGTCYAGMRYAVRKGRVTEASLMRDGKLLKQSPGGRKPVNPFTAEVNGREFEAKSEAVNS